MTNEYEDCWLPFKNESGYEYYDIDCPYCGKRVLHVCESYDSHYDYDTGEYFKETNDYNEWDYKPCEHVLYYRDNSDYMDNYRYSHSYDESTLIEEDIDSLDTSIEFVKKKVKL